ncbi:UNVERIFIED_CONTAM: hypothetical protein Slati_3013700 [Sesamum latifolium]
MDFAGINPILALNSVDSMKCGSWIIDTGASTHMCTDLNLFSYTKPAPKLNKITLPDGTTKRVQTMGDILLGSKIGLLDALHVPECHITGSPLTNWSVITVSNLHFFLPIVYCRTFGLNES